MRIVGGIYKGKKLFLPMDKKTRPLKDLVKESIFNVIEHSKKINLNTKDSLVLDLFSGSGSFGIECLSREAKEVIFFENYDQAIIVLERNLKSLQNIKNYKIIKKDCFEYFNSNDKIDFRFNIIFIDPPFKEIRINEIIETILKKKLLHENGIIILHRHKKDSIKLTNKINILEERKYGISNIFFIN
jgi:16S rRNA (guanine966-N2)-methyltransferase